MKTIAAAICGLVLGLMVQPISADHRETTLADDKLESIDSELSSIHSTLEETNDKLGTSTDRDSISSDVGSVHSTLEEINEKLEK